ncbi:MAG: cytochrome c3 family protein [Deltaproteobacteria bacterium]|nr:cytochrome c3 family protein [Deltaproteobacteria bacterium]MBW2218105.1 cytochrome c3 family protein [Deltaproteobacteria bacterium]
MRRVNIAMLSMMIIAVFVANGVVTAGEEEMCIPMGTLLLEPPADVKQERASVEFPHSLHFNYNCKRCHHKWDNEGEIKGCMTSGCHDQTTYSKKPLRKGKYTDESMKYYKYAYHNNCRTCHVELKTKKTDIVMSYDEPKELPETGPVGCTECHLKE